MAQTVLIRAEVIHEREGVLTVRLLNGFGDPEMIVHADAVIEYDPHKPIITSRP